MRHLAAPAHGGLRAYGDAALNTGGCALNMSRLDRYLSFDEEAGILEAEAGVRITDIVSTFSPKGWIPAVMPGTGFATLGGAIAADVHGKNHHLEGSFGQHVLDLRLVGADGESRVVSASAEPEIFRATLGGMGLTGVIESARIRLKPCPNPFMEVRETRIDNLVDYIAAFEASKAPYSVGWIDATATGPALGRGIFEEAHVSTRVMPAEKRGKPISIPRDAPSFFLAPSVVRAFNAFYFKRVPSIGRTRTRSLLDFFFPLDKLHNWNRLYGKRGFHQFQCVLPTDKAVHVLDEMMRKISASGLAAPLAVLKKMGAGRAGLMSFPMEGYTLAIDFPNRSAAIPLIADLEAMSCAAGGRIYLAKDSTLNPDMLAPMYPELGEFQEILRGLDPDGVFRTDLARRLGLGGGS